MSFDLRPVRALAVLLLACPSSAQGLVQIALQGHVAAAGGARVELAVTALVEGEARRAALALHVAQGTDAHTLCALLADRARGLGLALLFPAEHAGAGPRAVSLFFLDVTEVELRVPVGLSGRLVATEEAPSLVRLLPPQPAGGGSKPPGEARLLIAASTHHPVTEVHGRAWLELDLPADGNALRASEALFTRAVEAGWLVDRPANDAWRPLRVGESARVVGLSVEVESNGPDWGLALELESHRR